MLRTIQNEGGAGFEFNLNPSLPSPPLPLLVIRNEKVKELPGNGVVYRVSRNIIKTEVTISMLLME